MTTRRVSIVKIKEITCLLPLDVIPPVRLICVEQLASLVPSGWIMSPIVISLSGSILV